MLFSTRLLRLLGFFKEHRALIVSWQYASTNVQTTLVKHQVGRIPDTNNVKEDKVQYETTKTRAGMLLQSAANKYHSDQRFNMLCTNGSEAS